MALKIVLRLLVLVLVFNILATHQTWAEQECYNDKELVKARCKETIAIPGPYVPPTPSCTSAVQQSDMVCICRILKPEEELHISIPKFLRLARGCHKPVPLPGEQCGTYTVPPPSPSKSHP
ncbi:hypothetical protein EJB05_32705 [Eragrostis curvula]|uniref:Bifunctional inhibitor/plant lipid transfer protein/seed storage helical domain-containing protein n=1 Tax=Eragrostis curvula TaxID=38414 RepID=A0A5J9UIH1_9POAL|nr:hypothetical protein EJB05_32705 [Eragrostis curvula]